MRSAPRWVESERKGHFDIDSAQIQYRIPPSFWLDTGSCIVFGRQHHDARHYVLINSQFAGIMFKVRIGTASTFTVLYVFCLICGTRGFEC
jgi:hypothetical protein